MANCGTGTTTNTANCVTFPTAADARSKSLCPGTIWSEICVIQQAILAAIGSCQFSTTISGTSPITFSSFIQSIVVENGGVNYNIVPASANINHPTGVGAIITPIVTNGIITGFVINSGGTGYLPIEAIADTTGVGDSNAVFQPSIINGTLDAVYVLSGGTGYTVGDIINIVHPYGSGAVVRVATIDTGGRILSTVVESAGSGYDPINATIEMVHPNGSGFAGTVLQNSGSVVGISITNGGINYQTLTPTIQINTATGSGAEFLITVDDSGSILSVQIISGGAGYNISDTVDVIAVPGTGGNGALLSLQVVENEWGVNPIDYFNAWHNLVDGELQKAQLNFILNYFSCLGYNIQLETNPDTGNTLRWVVKW